MAGLGIITAVVGFVLGGLIIFLIAKFVFGKSDFLPKRFMNDPES